MSSFRDTTAEVRDAFATAGLFPPPERIAFLRARVKQRGAVELSRLRRQAGADVWDGGIARIDARDAKRSVQWALGHGAQLTGFAVAPLGLDGAQSRRVEELGALTNLVVTLYDNLLDQGIAPERVLSEDFRSGDPLITALVRLHYASADALTNQGARPLLNSVIRRMYCAENAAATMRDRRRKSALPFVVMGVAGWLATATLPVSRIGHLHFLYRCGVTLGLVDDAVDFASDAAAERPNSWRDGASVRHAARSMSNALDWWRRRSSASEEADWFRYCVFEWLRPRES